MIEQRDYLEDAASKDYKDYVGKGLKLRAKPFLDTNLPKSPNRLLVVGVALGGAEEIEALNRFFPDYKIFGIDIARSALKQNLNATLCYSDLSDLQFEDNYFSGIMCSAVMHEVYSYSDNGDKKVEKAILEIHRTLAKEGVCAIREFFVPEDTPSKLILLSKEAVEFTRKFIANFRKNFEHERSPKLSLRDKEVYGNRRMLTELMLHFRVSFAHFNSTEDFLDSKEIEERYLPISSKRYSKLILDKEMEIINTEYIDFPKYYPVIEKHFKLMGLNDKMLPNKFGFVDIVFRKK